MSMVLMMRSGICYFFVVLWSILISSGKIVVIVQLKFCMKLLRVIVFLGVCVWMLSSMRLSGNMMVVRLKMLIQSGSVMVGVNRSLRRLISFVLIVMKNSGWVVWNCMIRIGISIEYGSLISVNSDSRNLVVVGVILLMLMSIVGSQVNDMQVMVDDVLKIRVSVQVSGSCQS